MKLFLTRKNYASISDKLKKYFKRKIDTKFSIKYDSSHIVGIDHILCTCYQNEPIELIWTCYGMHYNPIYTLQISIGSRIEFKGTTIKIMVYFDNTPYNFVIKKYRPSDTIDIPWIV